MGFHAIVRGPNGAWSVDPAYQHDTSAYVAYRGVAVAQSAPEKAMNDEVGTAMQAAPRPAAPAAAGGVVVQRTYRLALANDPGYATLVGAANVDAVKPRP